MGPKEALAYNGLSSILCFFGMVLGVVLGNIGNVNPWIFAAAAGSFIYIALVDMVTQSISIKDKILTSYKWFLKKLYFVGARIEQRRWQ